MDITEAFRAEDLSKADFFDFVVTPDNADAQFQKQMRTVNAFLGSDEKETNNNNNNGELSSTTTTTGSSETGNFDMNFWGDKETVRIETAILEDLNKYCWNSEEEDGKGSSTTTTTTGGNGEGGHIYTLTVLNGMDQAGTWYRPPMTTVVKEEEGSISSPSSMEQLQTGLDIDSILNIMPNQLNGFNNNYQEGGAVNQNTDGLIKSETYTYEDSGFADNKDELASSMIIDTPLLEAHDGFNNNNNNDWKLSNNNTSNGSPDSLLRSALQGKAFVRYNGMKKESNAELRRALSTPPTKTETIYIKQEAADADKIPTIVAGIDANGTVIFEEQLPPPNGQMPRQSDADNSGSMDDILLSQLDSAYPEDFEKLKRIANEVAESVNQFCQIDTSVETVYAIGPDQIGLLNPISIAPVVTSSKPPTKKYKRSNSGGGKQTATVQSATSTSNGVRKERSLHYCSICSKGFKDKYSVNVHIRTHTGEKPFACSLCGKSFRQKAHLAKHYQTHIAQKNAAAAGGGGGVSAPKTKSR